MMKIWALLAIMRLWGSSYHVVSQRFHLQCEEVYLSKVEGVSTLRWIWRARVSSERRTFSLILEGSENLIIDYFATPLLTCQRTEERMR